MSQIVYNACYGGFGLSDAGVRRYAEIKGLRLYPERGLAGPTTTYWTVPEEERPAELAGDAWFAATIEERQAYNAAVSALTIYSRELERDDPVLVQVVEELGDAANGDYAKLRIEEVAPGSRYRIDEYDGFESVKTADDYDWQVAR